MMNSFEDAGKFGKEMMDNNLKAVANAAKGFQTIAAESAEYTRTAFENGTSALEKMFAAKSLEKALEIQADYMKTSYEGFVAQSTKVTDLMTDVATEAYKPFEKVVAKAK